MSDFWAKRLGTQVPPAPPAPAPAPASNRPWWMPAPVQQAPQITPPGGPLPNPAPVHQAQQEGSVLPSGEAHFGDLIRQDGYTTEKAQSARDGERCPDCGGVNYMRSKESPNSMKQCFECGYNPRFAHSTAGASGIGQQNVAPPVAARVQTMAEGNFNPGVIIGRVG